jgi:hypothetical protein
VSLSAHLLMLPQWLAISLLVVITVSFSIGGFLIVHRFIPAKVRQIHNDVAGFVFATLGVTYGVLLAFVVIVVWEQFNDAKLNLENESSTALVLYRNITAYPDKAASNTMLGELLGYARLATDERGQQLFEQSTDKAVEGMERLFAVIYSVVPNSEHERILYAQILQNLNELAKYRSLRLHSAREELPSVIWIGVVVGAIITIGFTFLFGTENFWAHITMMSLLAVLIAVVIYVVIEMDHPSLGAVNIGSPHGYSTILMKGEAKK